MTKRQIETVSDLRFQLMNLHPKFGDWYKIIPKQTLFSREILFMFK